MSNHPWSGQVQHITSQEQFQQLLSYDKDRLVVVDFGAQWCGPCRGIAPFYQELAGRYPKSIFLSVDADELPGLVEVCQVEAFPTFLFFKNLVKQAALKGAQRENLENLVKQHQGVDLSSRIKEGIIHVDDDWDFEELIAAARGRMVVADFFTTWCGPCKRIAPQFQALALQNPDVLFVKVDGEHCGATARKYQVNAWPTFLFFKDDLNCGLVRGANYPELLQTFTELKAIPPGEILSYYRSLQSGGLD